MESLRDQQIVSESQTDRARAEMLSRQGAVAVADAQVRRAEALLEAAKIRLGYTRVEASWTGPGDVRVVAARYADEGATLSANTALMSIVSLDPIVGIVYVTEKDYANLQANQAVQIRTDAYSDRPFTGRVSRIAPVFRQNSRQARVEMTIDNPESASGSVARSGRTTPRQRHCRSPLLATTSSLRSPWPSPSSASDPA